MTAPALTEFLLARIAEDESSGLFRGYSVALQRRIFLECEAKGRLVDALVDAEKQLSRSTSDPGMMLAELRAGILGAIACHFATVYADHPDYRQEWR